MMKMDQLGAPFGAVAVLTPDDSYFLMKGHIMLVRPHLDFDGRCDEAIAFYHRALGRCRYCRG